MICVYGVLSLEKIYFLLPPISGGDFSVCLGSYGLGGSAVSLTGIGGGCLLGRILEIMRGRL